MSTSLNNPSAASDDARYMALIRRHPLRRIRDEADYDDAVAIMQALTARVERGETLDPGEEDYLQVLEDLVTAYDDVHHAPPPAGSQQERLRYLIETAELQQKDLVAILDVNRSAVSMILSGQRQLTVEQVRKLAAYFRLSADYFI